MDRCGEVNDGAVSVALLAVRAAPVVVGVGIVGIEFDRLVVVGDGAVSVALVVGRSCPGCCRRGRSWDRAGSPRCSRRWRGRNLSCCRMRRPDCYRRRRGYAASPDPTGSAPAASNHLVPVRICISRATPPLGRKLSARIDRQQHCSCKECYLKSPNRMSPSGFRTREKDYHGCGRTIQQPPCLLV